jgi:hypothetical protein
VTEYCQATGKVAYASNGDAREALRGKARDPKRFKRTNAWKVKRTGRESVRSFQCQQCGCWHLGSPAGRK